MEELYNIGLCDSTIKNMLEINPDIKGLSNNDVIEKIKILKDLGCSSMQIRSIIGSNSMYLSRTDLEIHDLMNCLLKYGFTSLNVLFDANPYILNFEPFELDAYINNRKNNGERIEDIVDDLDSNPYLFNNI